MATNQQNIQAKIQNIIFLINETQKTQRKTKNKNH